MTIFHVHGTLLTVQNFFNILRSVVYFFIFIFIFIFFCKKYEKPILTMKLYFIKKYSLTVFWVVEFEATS